MDVTQIEFLDIEENENYCKIIERVASKCFEVEKLKDKNLYLSVILTNPEQIRKTNKNYRNIDKETDVLSFPMFEKYEIAEITGEYPEALGDIMISIDRVKEQAQEYGHSFERELSYMVVHGFYHLMGYDHMEENEKKEMREKEENILNLLNIVRVGKFKSGFVSLIGKTNAGKSTLLNSLVGEKVAITTYKTQTTRTAIKAIINRENSQTIITDTPGIHKGKSKLSKTMIDTAYTMIGEVDCVLFLIDGTEKNVSTENDQILDKIRKAKKPTILVINKVDLIPKEKILKLIETYKNEYNFASIIPVSALKNDGTETIINEIEKLLPEGPKYYDEEEYTDQTMRNLAEEVIREKALKLLNEEVPHGIFVEVQKFETKKTSEGVPFYNIEANIYCVRESHKGIIIGKGGEMLKKISTYARKDLERMYDCKVNLRTWVKVREDWINSESIVNQKFKLK